MTPFFANKGYHLRIGVELESTVVTLARTLQDLKEIVKDFKGNLTWTRELITTLANRYRRNSLRYKVVDKV